MGRNASVHVHTHEVFNSIRNAVFLSPYGVSRVIADPSFQLQSQVMVLGESASASEGNISTVLSRLAALEVRIGSIPVVSRSKLFAMAPG